MDLKEIRELVESEGGKIIIVEDSKPTLIVSSYEDQKRGRNKNQPIEPAIQRSQVQAFGSSRREGERIEDISEKELTIDDLPL